MTTRTVDGAGWVVARGRRGVVVETGGVSSGERSGLGFAPASGTKRRRRRGGGSYAGFAKAPRARR